jgi:hypothetical protein
MDSSIPHELVFDDEPLDGVLYVADCRGATPADILDRWCVSDDLPPECLGAVAAILGRNLDKGRSLENGQLVSIVDYMEQSLVADGSGNPRELLKLARLCHAAGRSEQAEAAYRLALEDGEKDCTLVAEERWQAMNDLADLLDLMGRTEDAREERTLREGEMLLADHKSEELITVRTLAFNLFFAGRYRDAEWLYRGLISRRFQHPGTLTHLARVLLMQDRLPEAREAIAFAWQLIRDREVQQENQSYILPRILFFRILFAMLARSSYASLVKRLKRELRGGNNRESWTIEPVITHFRQYLRPHDFNFLEAIAEAINSAENMDRLNAFEVWIAGKDAISN